MAVSGLWENIILTKIYYIPKLVHTIDDPYINAKSGNWCHGVWHQLIILWDPIPTTGGETEHSVGHLCCWLDGVGLLVWEESLFEM